MKKKKKKINTQGVLSNKNKILLLVVLPLLVLLLFVFYKHNSMLPKMLVVLPNSQKISVEVASDEKSRQKGLMFRKSLKQNEGMLFVFDDNSQKHFWMKNTFVDLDIIFIGEDFIINRIFKDIKKTAPNMKDSEIEMVSAKGKYILELAAGSAKKHRLRPGLKIEIINMSVKS